MRSAYVPSRIAERRDVDAIADGPRRHALAERGDDAGAVGAGRVGQLRQPRVVAGPHVGVDGVHARGVHAARRLRPGPATGSATSTSCMTSGPPNCSTRMALHGASIERVAGEGCGVADARGLKPRPADLWLQGLNPFVNRRRHLFVVQRLDRVELRGAHGGIDAEGQADRRRRRGRRCRIDCRP